MAAKFQEIMFTDSVRGAQQEYYGQPRPIMHAPGGDALTEDEIAFIHARDSFYMATITETGWPYVQHRGGAPGFLRVLSPAQLAFADYRGNRQLISTGNLAVGDRLMLFLMDYPGRTRLKIIGHACIEDARQHPDIVEQLAEPEIRDKVERLCFIEVVSYDWNCQQHITPRYTAEEIKGIVAPLQQRIAELESQLNLKP